MYMVLILLAIFIGLLLLTYWLLKKSLSNTNHVMVGRRRDALMYTPDGYISRYRCNPINQHDCNACWAIAICQTITDRMHLRGLLSLHDELNYYAYHDIIVDSTPDIDGCDTGIPLDVGLRMIVQEGAPLMSESRDRVFDDTPITSDLSQRRYRIDGWRHIPVSDIKEELHSNGPVVAVINLYKSFYSFRGKGIYTPRVGESIDGGVAHMVSIVGYDDRDNTWIVRNSHGTGFGDDGYCKIGMNDRRMGISNMVYAPNI